MNLDKGWDTEDSFKFWVPAQAVEVKKSGKGKSARRWIQGVASTNAKDFQNEEVVQQGIDFSYFLKNGYFNDNHDKSPAGKVGQPTECKVTSNGLFVKGFLFNNQSKSDEYWNLINALSASGSSRRVGFSLEGKTKRKAGNKITECFITNVALTTAPVNSATWCEIAKSLSVQSWDLHNSEEEISSESLNDSDKSIGLNEEGAVAAITKALTYDETIAYLLEEKNLDENAAVAVTNVVFKLF